MSGAEPAGVMLESRERPNLAIMPECLVHSVLIEGNRIVGRRWFGLVASEKIGLIMVVCLDLAVGSGSLHLQTADPHIQPFLDYNYLQEAFDRARLRDGVYIALGLGEHEGWARLVNERFEPKDEGLVSDATLDAWIKENGITSHHVSGTRKMDPDTDPLAVVDQFGNVRGTQNLKVADASIMPDCIRPNTNVTSMMIGERVAGFIEERL